MEAVVCRMVSNVPISRCHALALQWMPLLLRLAAWLTAAYLPGST